MQYISTRGSSKPLTFVEAVLEGLARDGGLLVPESIPSLSHKLGRLSRLSYQELALAIFTAFVEDEISQDSLKALIDKSYKTFSVEDVTPLRFLDEIVIMELFHGPTLAFKDVALQFLGNLFEKILKSKDVNLNILGATSGDTGSAAIHGVRGKERINIFMLHPKGKVSPIQEKQMTTVLDENVHNIAVEGTFDDAQAIVKQIFNDLEFRDQYNLGAVNSINWARVMAQIVYYFYAAFRYQEKYPSNPIVFSVPTGNFGDIYAGYLAKQMGLPIERLILATNENDILYRTLETGEYRISSVKETLSPSMDIQIASNFERYVFDLVGREGDRVMVKMNALSESGGFRLSDEELTATQEIFLPVRIDTEKTLETIRKYQQKGILFDPHTAVGIAAAESSDFDHVITLATAHAAKFSKAVIEATGNEPDYPPALNGILEKESRCFSVPNDYRAVEKLIKETLSR